MKGMIPALLLLPALASALQPNHIESQVTFSGEPLAAVKAIQNGFNAAGFKLEINSLSAENGRGMLRGTVVGIKPFDPDTVRENLQETGIAVEHAEAGKGTFALVVEAKNAAWNVPLIGTDEGAELQKASVPQWFRVQGGQTIRIEPPYGGKWYPDVAVLDGSMRVLHAFRSYKSEDEWSFELPEGAVYLKVSNLWGMKLLKEGMWIESITSGR